jgi:thiol:disulfide interchange protein DsbD
MSLRFLGLRAGLSLAAPLLASLQAATAHAQAPASRHVRAELVAETDGVQPGRPLALGIRLQMDPGWHTYWRNPGDSGLPTRVRWTLPEGFAAGELLWPSPERFTTGSLTSYGYEKDVLLPVELSVPATLAGGEVRLQARVDWLECQEICVPGKAELALTLPVRASVAPGRQAAFFVAARKRLPTPVAGWRVSASPANDSFALALVPPRGVAIARANFYVAVPRVLDHAAAQALARTPAGYRLSLPRDPNGLLPERLVGVLVVEGGGRERAFEIDAKMDVNPSRTR